MIRELDDDDLLFSMLTSGRSVEWPTESVESVLNRMVSELSMLPPLLTHLACNSRTAIRIRAAIVDGCAGSFDLPIDGCAGSFDLPIVVDEEVPDGTVEKHYKR